MLSMVEYVHQRIQQYPRDLVGVDMTMGNGHDTLMMSKWCREVYAFDIQKEAIENTKKRLEKTEHVHLILDGHQNVDRYLETFDIAVFNLGYLPLGDHQITTVLETTQIAIKKAIQMMTTAMWIVVYPGHQEGQKESVWINEYVQDLDTHCYNVSLFQMLNKKHAPYVIEIEKRSSQMQNDSCD